VLKVLYLGHTAKPSGGEIALSRMLPALGDRIEPLVVLAEDGPMVDRLRALDVPVEVLPLSATTRDLRREALGSPWAALRQVAGTVAYAWRIRRLIRERAIDVVHTNTLKAALYGCLAARLAGVPSVWHLRDRLAADYLPRPAVAGVRLAMLLLPTRIVCISQATLATVPSRLLRLCRRRALVPSPVHDILEAPPAAEAAPRDGANLRIGLVGRLSPWKGQHVAIRAFAEADLPPGARLLIVGSAMFGEEDYERQVRSEIDRLRLQGRVEMVGFVDDVFGVLATLDVLIHASTVPEPFGQVVVEGMAAGVAVVATREGGPSEIVTDRVDGLLYRAGDSSELARLLSELARDPDLCGRLRAGGLRRAQDFSAAAIAPQLLGVYDSIGQARH
jgi:glycosyltransferase involved in cell wall biosynthesis